MCSLEFEYDNFSHLSSLFLFYVNLNLHSRAMKLYFSQLHGCIGVKLAEMKEVSYLSISASHFSSFSPP